MTPLESVVSQHSPLRAVNPPNAAVSGRSERMRASGPLHVLGLEEIDDGIWSIYFCHVLLAASTSATTSSARESATGRFQGIAPLIIVALRGRARCVITPHGSRPGRTRRSWLFPHLQARHPQTQFHQVSPTFPVSSVTYLPGCTSTHSITLSARISSMDGILRPSVLAVFMLIQSSNTVDCSTGSSLGFVPLRILST